MKFENPQIHRCPKPWISEQKLNNMIVAIFSGVMIFFGAFNLVMILQIADNDPWAGIAISLFFFGIGIMIILVGIYCTNVENAQSFRAEMNRHKQ
ncbi:MAG: hypothetical protein Q7J68_01515 [Thermoplasmata archaeon]|nr:hypothetical protein [Thermoplasmata archaeon]